MLVGKILMDRGLSEVLRAKASSSVGVGYRGECTELNSPAIGTQTFKSNQLSMQLPQEDTENEKCEQKYRDSHYQQKKKSQLQDITETQISTFHQQHTRDGYNHQDIMSLEINFLRISKASLYESLFRKCSFPCPVGVQKPGEQGVKKNGDCHIEHGDMVLV